MVHKIILFIHEYTEFSLVVLLALVAAVLELTGQGTAAHILLATTALLACIPIIRGMVETLREGSYGLDVLALTAIIVAVLLQEYWAAIVIVIMLTGGESLEDYAAGRAQRELNALIERAPKIAHRLHDIHDDHPKDIAVERIRPKHILLVKPGEIIPIDGVILDGRATIDESSITGESLPVERSKNQTVLSGSVNLDSRLIIRAIHSSKDSQYEQIVRLVKDAISSKSPFVRLADRYSLPFTAISFVIAFSAWFISGDVMRFLEVLVVATPCPLLLGAPIALVSGMSRAAKAGIVMKNGAALERLAAARNIAFDKTGTLTLGHPKLVGVKTFQKMTRKRALSLAASIERNSSHILGQVLVTAARNEKIALQRIKISKEFSGKGIAATYDKQTILLGKLSFLKEHETQLPRHFRQTSVTQTAVYMAVDGRLTAIFLFEDVLRPESAETLQQLRRLGFSYMLMVTGDNRQTAHKIARELTIDEVKANCLPQDKLQIIKDVRTQKGTIAMVGDGVNDAPVLAASDVGLALGARGSTVASESADIVIMQDDLNKVTEAAQIARRTLRIGKQSIGIGIGISVILMLVFSTGRFTPVLGAAVQEVVDVVVIINALRAHSAGSSLLKRFKK